MEGAGTHNAEGVDTEKASHLCYLISTDTMLPLNVMNFLFIFSQVYYYMFSVYMNLWKANGDLCRFVLKKLNKSLRKH